MPQRFSKVVPKTQLAQFLSDQNDDPDIKIISQKDLGDSVEVVWENAAAPDLPEQGGGGGNASEQQPTTGGDFGSGPFKVKAPLVMKQLLKDFPEFNKVHVAAILGNIGVESAGFTAFHEFGQPEDKGGIGWCQWTGRPGRRQDFEKFCSDQNLNIRSDEASYKFLAHEMRGTEKGVVKPLSQMTDLAEATKFFMTKFERPGKKAEDERVKFAKTALDAFDAGS